jgi:hypothetical protein
LAPWAETAMRKKEDFGNYYCGEMLNKYFLFKRWCPKCSERNLEPENDWLPLKLEDDKEQFSYSFILCNACREHLFDSFLIGA